MADLPSAGVTIDDQAGAFAGSTGYAVVLAAVATNADGVPRVYASAKGLLSQHGYSQGAAYVALHIEKAKKPVIFVGMEIATPGVVCSQDDSGVTGTSVVTATAGSDGALEQVDAIFTVSKGGTIGTNGIVGTLSIDGGRSTKPVRLGTANSYAIPNIGVTLDFAAGTLVAGDVYLFRTTAPMWDSTGLTAARNALAAQKKLSRSWIVIGDLPNSTFAGYVTTEVNAYDTSHDRYVYARCSVPDRLPLGRKSKLDSQELTFAEVGVSGDTITRDAGSWVDDGFKAGDTIAVTGTASNNITGVIDTVTPTVITLTSADLAAEVISSELVTIVATTTKAAWVSKQDAAFAAVDNQKRIDLSIGRARKQCPILGALMRRPASWALSIREYEHDIQIPSWRKEDGILDGWTLDDADGQLEEFDERVDGGGLAARFSCLRTYSNGPEGTFGALSLTRENEGSMLSRTHNMAVANLFCTIVQAETENAIGRVLVLKKDGRATEDSLQKLEQNVNTQLEINLLQNKSEGPRASIAKWTASRDDILNVASPEMNGTGDLGLNSALERINTRVRVLTAGG